MKCFRAGTSARAPRKPLWLLLAAMLCAGAGHAQAKNPGSAAKGCKDEIPFGVTVVKLPEAEQKKVAISDFSVSESKDPMSYDLAMHIKNGSSWCLTSLAITYSFGDARGQQWTANEYPAVMEFRTEPVRTSPLPKGSKPPAPHGVGMPPGQEEKRMLFNVYNYIKERPTGYFDGFHLISAAINYCMGYPSPNRNK